jgi:hypothetical protein
MPLVLSTFQFTITHYIVWNDIVAISAKIQLSDMLGNSTRGTALQGLNVQMCGLLRHVYGQKP